MKTSQVLDAYSTNEAFDDSGIVRMSDDQIELVNGAAGSGWVPTVSGDCNSSGKSCNFLAPLSRFICGPTC